MPMISSSCYTNTHPFTLVSWFAVCYYIFPNTASIKMFSLSSFDKTVLGYLLHDTFK